MIRRLGLAVLVLLLASRALAQTLATVPPEQVGLSAQRLERIAGAVQRELDQRRVAGAVTLVVRRGKVAWLRAQGMADREAGQPMRTDAIFRICSMTKPITSLAVMMLYEEGRFLLEDPVSAYLPEFKNPKVLVKQPKGEPSLVPAEREISILDLLRHTSGLTYNWHTDLGPLYNKAGVASGLLEADIDLAENVRRLAAQPLLFQPGSRFEYSLGVDVLGRLVEVVSAMPLDQFFQKRIFTPLGMKDTSFYPGPDQAGRLATAYTWEAGKGLARFPDHAITEGILTYSASYPLRGARKLFSGGAGLTSTAMDYARFAQMMLNGGRLGNVRLLSRKSVELMTQDHLGKIAPEEGFGLGFGLSGGKAPLVDLGSPGTFGWGGFFSTSFSIDPKEQMIVLFMSQAHPNGDSPLERLVSNMAYQAIVD